MRFKLSSALILILAVMGIIIILAVFMRLLAVGIIIALVVGAIYLLYRFLKRKI